jgi:hypothetical protein
LFQGWQKPGVFCVSLFFLGFFGFIGGVFLVFGLLNKSHSSVGQGVIHMHTKFIPPQKIIISFNFQVKKMGILTANMQKQISQKKPSGGGKQSTS